MACEQRILCDKSYHFIHSEYGFPKTNLTRFILTIDPITKVRDIKHLKKIIKEGLIRRGNIRMDMETPENICARLPHLSNKGRGRLFCGRSIN